jgi:ABC-2 type transport system permease protein
MKKFWLVAIYEYLHHVRRRRFIFALLSMPFFVGLFVGLGIIIAYAQHNPKPFGYVDLSGWLVNPKPLPPQTDALFAPLEMRRYSTELEARAALQSDQIQAYYIIQPDYLQTGRVRVITRSSTGNTPNSEFSDFLRLNLLTGYPDPIVQRVLDGSALTVRSADGSRQMASDQWWNILLPLLSGILFIIVVNMSSGYLLQAVVDEKENRTMEIIITSVSPEELMGGKIIGNLSVGLTQMVVWMVFAFIGWIFVRRYFFPNIHVMLDAGFVLLQVVTLLLGFIMVSAFMAAIGSTATEAREAQQVAGWFTIPMVLPYWFASQVMMNPNGLLALGFSLFPLTAPISLPLRAAFTPIPAWQFIVSLGLLLAGCVGSIWLAARAFRLGMLRYGKRISLKELFARG